LPVTIPIKKANVSGTLSASKNCIGSYNASGLDPNNKDPKDPTFSCFPDATHPSFVKPGTIENFLVLEDLDKAIIQAPTNDGGVLKLSLCAILGGPMNTNMYGNCRRDGAGGTTGNIGLIRAARAATGLRDFGEDGFREPLR